MNEDLSQPWPHPFLPSTASDGAGHIEINPSMLPPTMTPPQTDLAAMRKLWQHRGDSTDARILWDAETRNKILPLMDELAELRQDLYETNESYEKAAHDRDAAVRDCRKLRSQLAASQESERRMRGLVKKSIDYLRDVFGQDPAELRAELEAALLTTPVKAEGEDGKLKSALKELFALVNGESPRLLDDDCGGDGKLYMEIEELLKEPTTPLADEIGVEAINREEGK